MEEKKRILVVDDDRSTREAASELLEIMEYPVALADTGQSALAYLEKCGNSVGLILLDLDMPVMNGWEFLRQFHLNSSLSGIPVLILSGLDAPVPEYAQAILKKPVKVQELFKNISRYSKNAASS